MADKRINTDRKKGHLTALDGGLFPTSDTSEEEAYTNRVHMVYDIIKSPDDADFDPDQESETLQRAVRIVVAAETHTIERNAEPYKPSPGERLRRADDAAHAATVNKARAIQETKEQQRRTRQNSLRNRMLRSHISVVRGEPKDRER